MNKRDAEAVLAVIRLVLDDLHPTIPDDQNDLRLTMRALEVEQWDGTPGPLAKEAMKILIGEES